MSQKYGRTYHYPFSPGTTSDDRINHGYWEDIQQIEHLVHTEKLDRRPATNGAKPRLSRRRQCSRTHPHGT